MMRYIKILFLGMVVIGLMVLPAMAVDLLNRGGNSFGTGTSTSNAYPIAFEAYSNVGGVSTIADDGTHMGLIEVKLTASLSIGDNVDLKISNGTAKFVSAGPNFKFGLCLPTGLPKICDAAGIVGVLNLSGVTTDDLGFQITKNVVIPPPSTATLWVVQWDDSLGAISTDIDTALEVNSVKNGVGLSVNAGLTPNSCDSLPAFIKITFSTPHESSLVAKNFAYITPQFSIPPGGRPGTTSVQAELDTDFDFTQFVPGSNINIDPVDLYEMNVTPGVTGNFFTVADNVADFWIAFVTGTVPVIDFSFDIISAVKEPNVTVEFAEASNDFDPTECTTTNDRIFHCTRTLPLIGNYQLELEIEGGPADPTSWRLANFVSPSNFCLRLPNQELGVWSGGLEAFVPFVKGTDDRSYATYIKLFNRYNLPAKVFVSTFADNPGGSDARIMVSTAQLPAPLDSIPAGDYITITDQDIGLFVPGYDMSKGLPVKFNIRVPSGIGTTGSIGSWNFLGETQADLTHQNPYDPFVEGIVISIYPVGGQRSIPLKFKGFKNGEYNH